MTGSLAEGVDSSPSVDLVARRGGLRSADILSHRQDTRHAYGGHEVVVVVERDLNDAARFEYALLATSRTSTMQRELADAGRRGFRIVGLSVGVTSFGGQELVAVVERPLSP